MTNPQLTKEQGREKGLLHYILAEVTSSLNKKNINIKAKGKQADSSLP